MGIDFIHKTKATQKKGWDKAKQKLSIDDLFSFAPEKIRTIQVKPEPSTEFCEDDTYMLRIQEGVILVYLGQNILGVCKNPALSVVKKIQEGGGMSIGKLHQKREISGTVDIAVCFETLNENRNYEQ